MCETCCEYFISVIDLLEILTYLQYAGGLDMTKLIFNEGRDAALELLDVKLAVRSQSTRK